MRVFGFKILAWNPLTYVFSRFFISPDNIEKLIVFTSDNPKVFGTDNLTGRQWYVYPPYFFCYFLV